MAGQSGVEVWISGERASGASFVVIIRTPRGEAPFWVRDAWVGLRLPLAANGVQTDHAVGVLSGPRTVLGFLWARMTGRTSVERGYLVNASAAVALLEETNSEAAAWWRENAAHLLNGERNFQFDAQACRPVDLSAATSKIAD